MKGCEFPLEKLLGWRCAILIEKAVARRIFCVQGKEMRNLFVLVVKMDSWQEKIDCWIG